MTHRLTSIYAKNYCNRTLIVKVIIENVVTCFFGGHGVDYMLITSQCHSTWYAARISTCGQHKKPSNAM